MVFVIWNKVNGISGKLDSETSPLMVNEINTCVLDCDKNLCLNGFNTQDCEKTPKADQLGCRTKNDCYTVCIDYFNERIDSKCF